MEFLDILYQYIYYILILQGSRQQAAWEINPERPKLLGLCSGKISLDAEGYPDFKFSILDTLTEQIFST